MKHGVLDAADILVDRQPIVGRRRVDRRARVRVREPREVPGRIDEGVQGVGLAFGRAAAGWACRVFPGRMPRQRIAGLAEIQAVRQAHGKVAGRNRDDAASLAVDHGDRTPPAPLTRHAPVPQAIDGGSLADALGLRP
jgi:hypothetical protein